MPLANNSFLDNENSHDRRDVSRMVDATFEGMADTNAWANATGKGTFGALTDEESIKNWFDQSGFEFSPFGFLAKPDQYKAAVPASQTVFDPRAAEKAVNAARDNAMGNYPKWDGSEYRRGMNRLESVFGGIEDAYDASATIDAANEANAATLLAGQQSADSIARSYREQLHPGASGDIGARMMRAKSLIPILDTVGKNRVETQKYADSSKRDATRLSADLATQMGNLSLDYTKSLAKYNSDKAQNALGYAGLAQDRQIEAGRQKANAADLAYKYDTLNADNRNSYMNRIYAGLDSLSGLMRQGASSGSGSGYTEGARYAGGGSRGATEQSTQSSQPALNLALYGLGSSHDEYKIW